MEVSDRDITLLSSLWTRLALLRPFHRICATAMLSNWPPGIFFIFNTVLTLTPPLLSVLVVHQLIPQTLSSYVWTAACLLVLPLTFFIKNSLQWIRESSELRRLGGRRIPQVPSAWPGGIDLLRRIEQSHLRGYLCGFFYCPPLCQFPKSSAFRRLLVRL